MIFNIRISPTYCEEYIKQNKVIKSDTISVFYKNSDMFTNILKMASGPNCFDQAIRLKKSMVLFVHR